MAQNPFVGNIDCTISLPLRNDEVKYQGTIWIDGDDYLVEYATERDTLKNFAAYYDNNFYKFERDRLREYHRFEDSIPFIAQGKKKPIQQSGLFPQFFPENLQSLIQDTAYRVTEFRDTTLHGKRVNGVKIQELYREEVVRDIIIGYHRQSQLPLFYESVNNPGAISEQTISVSYSYPDSLRKIGKMTEELLLMRYPEVFMKYRVSNFALENMPGRRLPDFSLPSTTGERYTWSGVFNNKALLVFLDPENGFNTNLIISVRNAVASSPCPIDVLWLFRTNNVESAMLEIPETGIGEYALISGNRFAAECGVTSCPVILFANKEGFVESITIGYNKNIGDIIMRNISSF